MSGYADPTLLTMLQVAAYTAPGTFEQGVALTTQEETPSFAFTLTCRRISPWPGSGRLKQGC